MTIPISTELRLWRFAAIGLGILWLLWLPFEDTSERWVIFFAMAICSLLVARVLISPFASKYRFRNRNTGQGHPGIIRIYLFFALFGALAGVGVTLVALLLMAFKTGLHGHLAPDYTINQLIAVVQLTPVWMLGAVLVSLGFAFWQSRHG